MKTLRKIIGIILLYILFVLNVSFASGIHNIYAVGNVISNEKLSVNTRFIIDLPEELKYILTQGVSIYFNLTYDTTKSIFSSYKLKFSRLFGGSNSIIEYKLSYHPLTRTYIVSRDSDLFEYNNLESALKAIGFIYNWILDVNLANLFNNYTDNFNILVKLSLSISKLPKIYQIKAITSNIWNLDSNWVKVRIQN